MTPRRLRRAAAAAAALAVPCLVGGCQSQWLLQDERGQIVRTEIVVRTEPTGAEVFLDGRRMDVAPVRIPVEYDHVVQQWVRQSNHGAAMRERLGTAGTILLFPVWAVASLVHGEQEMKRHVYEGNRHVVTVRVPGWEDAERTVALDGEEQVEVVIHLSPAAR